MKKIIRLAPVLFLFSAMLIFGGRDYQEAEASPLSLEVLNRLIGLSGAILLSLAYLVSADKVLNVGKPMRMYALYIFACIVSSLFYSEWIMYSLWKVGELFAVFIVSVYVSTRAVKTPSIAFEFYEICLAFLIFLVVVTLIGALVNPVIAIRSPIGEATVEAYGSAILPYQLFGTIIQVNPNSLGAMGAILTYVYLIRILEKPGNIKNTVIFVLAITVLIFAQSRTAIIGLLCAILYYLAFTGRNRSHIKALIAMLIGVFLVFAAPLFYDYMTRGVSAEQLQHMSGRKLWWDIAWTRYMNSSFDQQLFGLGFMTANRIITLDELGYSVSTLHSDYMDTLISVGMGGILFFTLFVFYSMRRIMRIKHSADTVAREIIGIAIILLIRSFTGTSFAVFNFFLPIFVSLVILSGVLLRARLHSNKLPNL